MRRLGKNSGRWMGMVTVLAVFAALVFVAGRSGAQDEEAAAYGRVTYRVYCQNCHGNDAKGNGHLASLMKVQPADLTRISKKHGGIFPSDEVNRIIDGREEVLAHGAREMPVWGDALTGNQEEVQQKIRRLIAYLESIQEKGEAAKKGS